MAKGDVVWVIVGGEHVEMYGEGVVHAKDEEWVLFYEAHFM